MQLKTILNQVTSYKSFVIGKTNWIEENGEKIALEVELRARANGRPICSGCHQVRPGYDKSREPRRFEFVPLWGIMVYFVYHMRRVNCPNCGVKVEGVPWAEGKSPMTIEYKWFLGRWAKRMSWKEVSEAFRVSWDRVYEAVKYAVSWGLEHRDLSGIEAIGVDEVQWHRGHQYQTVVYQLDEDRKRLLWIGPNRTAKTLLRPENLTEKQAVKLKEILQYNLKSVRSHLMKEDFQRFWQYWSPTWAGKFLDQWCTRAMRSRIEPMKKVARMLRQKRELIINWFRAEGKLSAGIVEGFNNKLKLITRKSYGFRTQNAYEIALYHNLGDLPEPEFTHDDTAGVFARVLAVFVTRVGLFLRGVLGLLHSEAPLGASFFAEFEKSRSVAF